MRLDLTDRVVITSTFRNGQRYYWDAQIYSKIKDLGLRAHRLFNEVNGFYESLPDEKIYIVETFYDNVQSILGKARARFSSTQKDYRKTIETITAELIEETTKLFNVVTLDDIADWSNKNPVKVPDSIANEHMGSYSIDGTYLVEDYKLLVDLCIAIRMMVPVWCEFISLIQSIVSQNDHEISCLGLLKNCDGIMNSKAMNKLKAYVAEKCKLEISKASTAILNGLPRSKIQEWVISVTIVKRLGIGEISANEERSHLVTSIFGFIQGILTRDLDRKNTGRIRDKFAFLTKDNDDSDRNSFIEQYRVRQDITEGNVVLYETYLKKYPLKAAQELVKYRDLSTEEMSRYLNCVKTCIEYTEKLNEVDLITAQKSILAWTVNDLVPYQMIDRLDPSVYRILLGIAQGYLWYFNLPDVACALTAYHDVSIEAGLLIHTPNARVSPNMHQRLSSIYNHSYPRSLTEQSEEEIRRNNVGVGPVREVIRGLNNGLFTVRAPEELWSTASSYQKSGRVIFKNISDQMVLLVEIISEVV